MAKNKDTEIRVCPVCGKKFLPAPYHAYKIYDKYHNLKKLVCSYSCVRDDEAKITSKYNKRV